MAIKGLSIPVFGRYSYDPKTKKVNYTDGMINPAAIEYSASIESTEDNPLYGNNRIIENDIGRFNGGTLELGVDDLTNETSAYLLGMKEVEETYGIDGKTVKVLVADDSQQSPVLGTGIIEEHQNGGATSYKAVVFLKTTYMIPESAATTRGETVEWQTPTISSAIERSEEESEDLLNPWKKSADFSTESEAIAYLKYVLGVLGTLTLTSEAGTSSGDTKITVTETKGTASEYKYLVSEEGEIPKGGEILGSGWQDWDGSQDITAENGQTLVMAECVSGRVVNAGSVIVVANVGG